MFEDYLVVRIIEQTSEFENIGPSAGCLYSPEKVEKF